MEERLDVVEPDDGTGEDAEDSENPVSEGQLSEENASEQDLPTP